MPTTEPVVSGNCASGNCASGDCGSAESDPPSASARSTAASAPVLASDGEPFWLLQPERTLQAMITCAKRDILPPLVLVERAHNGARKRPGALARSANGLSPRA